MGIYGGFPKCVHFQLHIQFWSGAWGVYFHRVDLYVRIIHLFWLQEPPNYGMHCLLFPSILGGKISFYFNFFIHILESIRSFIQSTLSHMSIKFCIENNNIKQTQQKRKETPVSGGGPNKPNNNKSICPSLNIECKKY